MNIKKCSKCKIIKPVDEFYKDKYGNNGYGNWCKKCQLNHKKSLNFPLDTDLKEKLCSKCKIIKSIDNFTKNKINRNGYKSKCKQCISNYKKQFKYIPNENIKEKQCSKCNEVKPINKFTKNKTNKTGYDYRCKKCRERNTLKLRFTYWKSSAKQRNIQWELKFEDIKSIPQICYYTGRKLTLNPRFSNTISLDRINSRKGYTKDNIVLCCESINKMKHILTYDQFICECRAIIQHYDNKIN
jgi:hypothetical protein